MDHLHFGARSRRKVRRRQLAITAWLIGIVATLMGVPGSNAALTAFHSFETSQGVAASSLAAKSSALSPAPRTGSMQKLIPPRLRAVSPQEKQPGPTRPNHQPHIQAKKSPPTKPTATPSPAPSPTATPSAAPVPVAPAGSISAVIYAAAAEAGISGSYLLSMASCESALNPQAYSSAGYYGLFQFDEATWGAYGYGSIYDPVAQSRTAARLIAAGQSHRWPNCA